MSPGFNVGFVRLCDWMLIAAAGSSAVRTFINSSKAAVTAQFSENIRSWRSILWSAAHFKAIDLWPYVLNVCVLPKGGIFKLKLRMPKRDFFFVVLLSFSWFKKKEKSASDGSNCGLSVGLVNTKTCWGEIRWRLESGSGTGETRPPQSQTSVFAPNMVIFHSCWGLKKKERNKLNLLGSFLVILVTQCIALWSFIKFPSVSKSGSQVGVFFQADASFLKIFI